MTPQYSFLFNFSASPVGGGLKRLSEYARWFDAHGGAWFAIHPRCAHLRHDFPRNEFVVIEQSSVRRMLGNLREIRHFSAQIGTLECYYAYGVPMYERLGALNWFHLSNALPLCWRRVPMPLRDTLKFGVLGHRLRQHMGNADVISAESQASLALIDPALRDRLFLSVNGSDDELAHLRSGEVLAKEPIATVVGTYRHKALEDSCRVFDMLRSGDDRLRLLIFGDAAWIPRELRAHPHVVVMGNRPRAEVIATLRRSRYCISTTRVENSSNAASEGVFFADESYLSDIGPHRELLDGMPYDDVAVPGVARPMLHVVRQRVSGANLKSWDDVVGGMIARIRGGPAAASQGLR